jgi:hypothetical protein
VSGLVIAVAPALPLHSAGKYVAGAYIVFLALVLIYVSIMARRLTRTQRELRELRRQTQAPTDAPAEESARAKEHVA